MDQVQKVHKRTQLSLEVSSIYTTPNTKLAALSQPLLSEPLLFAHSVLARTTLPTLGSGVGLVYYCKSEKKSIFSVDF